MQNYNIKDIFKVKKPYVLKFIGNFDSLKSKLEEKKQLREKSYIGYFDGKKMKTAEDYLEEFIKKLHFDNYIRGGCGRNHNALEECLGCLDESFELVGLDYKAFVLVIKNSEYLYSEDIGELEGYSSYADYYLSEGEIRLFNTAAEDMSEEIKGKYEDGTPYYRPSIPYHVIFQTQKEDLEFIKNLPLLEI